MWHCLEYSITVFCNVIARKPACPHQTKDSENSLVIKEVSKVSWCQKQQSIHKEVVVIDVLVKQTKDFNRDDRCSRPGWNQSSTSFFLVVLKNEAMFCCPYIVTS